MPRYSIPGQISFMGIKETPDYIKDSDCTKDTPIIHGFADSPIYGQAVRIKPAVPGRSDTEHMKNINLDSLLPLEEYDLIVVLLSGGKDSIACYYKLLELGVPKEKMEFWHHDIDGGHPVRHMDWRCTQEYVKAFAQAEGGAFADIMEKKWIFRRTLPHRSIRTRRMGRT